MSPEMTYVDALNDYCHYAHKRLNSLNIVYVFKPVQKVQDVMANNCSNLADKKIHSKKISHDKRLTHLK